MNEKDLELANRVSHEIIGSAIEVHRCLGPGLLERVYRRAMCIELDERGLSYWSEVQAPAVYKGHTVGEYRIDMIVEDSVIVEIKSVERNDPVFCAQLLTYLRVLDKPLGLLINFNSKLLHHGVQRFVFDRTRSASPERLDPEKRL
jgi:GxxExxY protein